MRKVTINFQPSGKAVTITAGTTILEAASQCGFNLNIPCGGSGTCGKCKVRISDGQTKVTKSDEGFFDLSELERGWRLACTAVVEQDITVELPQTSLVDSSHKIVTDIGTRQEIEICPPVKKVCAKLPQPSLEDCRSDLTRVQDIIGADKMSIELLRKLPKLLREANFGATFTTLGNRVTEIASGDCQDRHYGIAFDIGTTTLAGKLLCLNSGKELAVVSQMNPQVSLGDDVISRINYASKEGGLERLNQAIVDEVNQMCKQLCEQALIKLSDISCITVAGNTTMLELFCRIDPAPLGEMPFISAFGDGFWVTADELGLELCSNASVFIFPVIGSFVGGDTTACIIASNILSEDKKVLMIDIGTNGEIVLKDGKNLTAASTAAGPALEGARISCGMRACSGAIEHIDFDEDIKYRVIGDAKPVGICGSAIIDIAACLLNCGIVSYTGQMLKPDELDNSIPEPIRSRVELDCEGNPEFVIIKTDENNISITQRDIRELQLASGAIRAGINILLKHNRLSIDELDEILIAGGFGQFIRQSNACRIGLLPQVKDMEKIKYIGNAALAGAELALLSEQKLDQARAAAVKTKHAELSLDLDFQMEFAEAMMYPQS